MTPLNPSPPLSEKLRAMLRDYENDALSARGFVQATRALLAAQPAEGELASKAGAGDEVARLLDDVDQMANFIVQHSRDFFGDHACAECWPDSEILISGFQCALHKAKSRLAVIASANRPGGVLKPRSDKGVFWILEDGDNVTIWEQKTGEMPTGRIVIPRDEFSRLIRWHARAALANGERT